LGVEGCGWTECWMCGLWLPEVSRKQNIRTQKHRHIVQNVRSIFVRIAWNISHLSFTKKIEEPE
jgi:hypothetical protein